MIRPSEMSDLPEALELFKVFHANTEGNYGVGYNETDVKTSIQGFLAEGLCYTLEIDGKVKGFIGGVIQPMLSDFSQKMFVECSWYVDPKFRKDGLKLLKEVEKYCEAHEIDFVLIGHMGDRDYGKIYNRLGYKPFEVHYMKDVRCQK